MQHKQLGPGVFAGPQLEEQALRRLSEEGFVAVIDLRRGGENGNLLPPDKEERVVKEMGLEYVHIPVNWKKMRFDQVDRFRQVLRSIEGNVYVHSRARGGRAATFLLIDRAVQDRQDPQEAARTAEQMRAIRAGTRADDFIAQYVAARTRLEED